MYTVICSVVASICSAATLALFGVFARYVIHRFKALQDAERADLKCWIVELYERCKVRGYVTHYELDILERKFEAYVALGGNSYIAELVERIRHFDIGGEPLPVH